MAISEVMNALGWSPPVTGAPAVWRTAPGAGCCAASPRADKMPEADMDVCVTSLAQNHGRRCPVQQQDLIWLNGDVIPMADASVGVEDRGYQFADGIYEVIRIYNGRPFTLREHMERLGRS